MTTLPHKTCHKHNEPTNKLSKTNKQTNKQKKTKKRSSIAPCDSVAKRDGHAHDGEEHHHGHDRAKAVPRPEQTHGWRAELNTGRHTSGEKEGTRVCVSVCLCVCVRARQEQKYGVQAEQPGNEQTLAVGCCKHTHTHTRMVLHFLR